MDMDIDSGTHRCPSVITASTSPCYPCRCPFVTGNPCPSVIVVIVPASVVERCPSPGKARYPSVSVIGHHPVAVSGIWMKVSTHIGDPDAAVIAVVDPSSVRPQLVVEHIE